MQRVKAKAYSTIANLGPGFDVFGISVDAGYDNVQAETIEKGLEIEISGIGSEKLPTDPDKNTAGLVAKEILGFFQIKKGLKIKIQKGIRPGSGLGSSAASAAALAVALNKLFNLGLSKIELIKYASIGEIAAAGVAHADNVAAAILGGFTIVRTYNPLDVLNIRPPSGIRFCVALPEIEVATKIARSLLPKEVQLTSFVHNVGNASSLVYGMFRGNIDLVGRSMSDVIVEPARASLIPGYELVKKYAKEAGASGVAISGAGPAMVAIVNPRKINPKRVAQNMKKGFMEAGVKSEIFICKPALGSTVLEVK